MKLPPGFRQTGFIEKQGLPSCPVFQEKKHIPQEKCSEIFDEFAKKVGDGPFVLVCGNQLLKKPPGNT